MTSLFLWLVFCRLIEWEIIISSLINSWVMKMHFLWDAALVKMKEQWVFLVSTNIKEVIKLVCFQAACISVNLPPRCWLCRNNEPLMILHILPLWGSFYTRIVYFKIILRASSKCCRRYWDRIWQTGPRTSFRIQISEVWFAGDGLVIDLAPANLSWITYEFPILI